jgi:hypothetical protein
MPGSLQETSRSMYLDNRSSRAHRRKSGREEGPLFLGGGSQGSRD